MKDKNKRRSKLELTFEQIIKEWETEYAYEVTKIPYTIPASDHVYTVDFSISNGCLIEVKGWLKNYEERRKYILLKEQHPELDLKFVFGNPNKFCGGTKMTHAQWATKNNFKWCSITDHEQIKSWVKESNK